MSFFTGLIGQWVLRRIMELGGLVGALLAAWNQLPPEAQGAILALLGRNWEQITIGSLIPLAVMLWGYVWSLLSTIKPQVVIDGKQVAMPRIASDKQTIVQEAARSAAAKPRTLWERLTGK